MSSSCHSSLNSSVSVECKDAQDKEEKHIVSTFKESENQFEKEPGTGKWKHTLCELVQSRHPNNQPKKLEIATTCENIFLF